MLVYLEPLTLDAVAGVCSNAAIHLVPNVKVGSKPNKCLYDWVRV